jgi:alkaline phosphatase D
MEGATAMTAIRNGIEMLTRRGFARAAAGLAAFAALRPERALAQPVFHAYPFRLGVASGDPWPDGVVLWTRLAPDPLAGGGMPARAVEVSWEVAEDERFRTIVARGTALARPELGHAVHVEVGGLAPARPYWYRFRAGAEVSPTGRTRTAPAPDATQPRIRFANVGCQRYEDGYFTAYAHLAAEELDLVFHYGDYMYEYRNRRGPQPIVREITGDETYSLTDYRNRYALYKLDADLAAAHAAHPFVVTFDDHEVDNNWAGMISEEDGSAAFPVAVPPEIFALRKQMALHAWYEAMPVRRAQLPRGPEITAYRRLRYGRLLTLHALDTRAFRDDQPCGDGVKAGCADRLRPGSQILGAAQEGWLMQGLAEGGSTWSVLAQQVSVMPRRFGEGPDFAFSMDKWDAYADARARLTRFIHDRGVRNVVVLTGDVHNAWAGEVKLDAEDDASPTVATEFIATSISSNGDGSETLPNTPQVLRNNPHIRFFNNRRGYTLHEATAERLTASFKVVPYVSRPGAPLETRATFAVPAGEAKLVAA